MTEQPSSGYWYADGRSAPASVDVLNLLRRYRESERRMRARTRGSMGMGETDLLALRYLLEAQRRGISLTQRDLVARLQISSASVSVLIDRLVRDDHVRREPHPTDKRSVYIVPTTGTDHEVRQTLGRMHQEMVSVVDGLSPDELAVVGRFLQGMIGAVETGAAALDAKIESDGATV
nr:MarR family transcriptional regulator [Herbiconiux sp. L3-i23]